MKRVGFGQPFSVASKPRRVGVTDAVLLCIEDSRVRVRDFWARRECAMLSAMNLGLAFALVVSLTGRVSAADPAGGRILYESTRSGNSEIWIINADGTGARQLTDFRKLRPRDKFLPRVDLDDIKPGETPDFHQSADQYGTWSPDGKQIAFVSKQGGEPDSEIIFVMDLKTGKARPVASTNAFILSLAWSPDGRFLAFDEGGGPQNGERACYILSLKKKVRGKIPTPNDVSCGGPSWSPDGRRIAVELQLPGDKVFQIYTLDADGSRFGRLTRLSRVKTAGGLPSHDESPKWSPDGASIAFTSGGWNMESDDSSIWIMGWDGSNPRRMIASNMFKDRVSWSPDGSRIATSAGPIGKEDIWIMNADGSSPVNLTRDGASSSLPAWEPAVRAR